MEHEDTDLQSFSNGEGLDNEDGVTDPRRPDWLGDAVPGRLALRAIRDLSNGFVDRAGRIRVGGLIWLQRSPW